MILLCPPCRYVQDWKTDALESKHTSSVAGGATLLNGCLMLGCSPVLS